MPSAIIHPSLLDSVCLDSVYQFGTTFTHSHLHFYLLFLPCCSLLNFDLEPLCSSTRIPVRDRCFFQNLCLYLNIFDLYYRFPILFHFLSFCFKHYGFNETPGTRPKFLSCTWPYTPDQTVMQLIFVLSPLPFCTRLTRRLTYILLLCSFSPQKTF